MLSELTPATVDAMVEVAGPGSGSPLLMVELRHLGGALGRRAPHAGALGSFAGEYLMFALTIPMAPELVEAFAATAPRLLAALAPVTDGRNYLNFVESETDPATFYEPGAYERLRAIKATVDGGGIFQANHQIR
jgi:hypothetical protein